MNPYEPPSTQVEPSSDFQEYKVGKRGIIGGSSIRLPRRCIQTNEVLTRESDMLTRRRESLREPLTGQWCSVEYSISVQGIRWRQFFQLLGWLLLTGGILPFFLSAHWVNYSQVLLMMIFGGLIIVLQIRRRLHLENVWNGHYHVTGFSRRFLNSLRNGETDVDP